MQASQGANLKSWREETKWGFIYAPGMRTDHWSCGKVLSSVWHWYRTFPITLPSHSTPHLMLIVKSSTPQCWHWHINRHCNNYDLEQLLLHHIPMPQGVKTWDTCVLSNGYFFCFLFFFFCFAEQLFTLDMFTGTSTSWRRLLWPTSHTMTHTVCTISMRSGVLLLFSQKFVMLPVSYSNLTTSTPNIFSKETLPFVVSSV